MILMMPEGEAEKSDRPRTLIYRSGFVVSEEGNRILNKAQWEEEWIFDFNAGVSAVE